MIKIGICGHYAKGYDYTDGQTVKTRIIADELIKKFGENEVEILDTCGAKKNLPKQIVKIVSLLKRSENVIILPSRNGLRVFAPVLALANVFLKRKLHYIVIGGILPKYVKKRKWLAASLKKFDFIYVETQKMKKDMEAQEFGNIVLMPNCKKLNIVNEQDLNYDFKEPYKLCTFSRVMKEKGIETAAKAVKAVNEKVGRIVYKLDIYGPVDVNQTEWFDDLKNTFPEYVRYCGCVPYAKSVDVLKDYFALLFPTYYQGEGLAGTVIDAMAAGIPVIASDWNHNADVVKDRLTGRIFETENLEQFIKILLEISEKPEIITDMKKNCIAEAKKYTPELVMPIVTERL